PANCAVSEPIPTSATGQLESGTSMLFTGTGTGVKFASVTLTGASCSLKAKPFEVTGTQKCSLPGGETEGKKHEIGCETTGSKLEAGGKPATVEGTVSGLTLASGENYSSQ